MNKPDPEVLHVLGIHVCAVLSLGKALATLTKTDEKKLIASALKEAREQIEASSPEALEDLCHELITTIHPSA